MIPTVRGVTAASTAPASRQNVSSISTKTGLAPQWISGSIVGMAVWEGTITSSPGLESLGQVHHIDDHRPGGTEHAVLRAGVRGQFGFKRLAFLGQDILAGAQGAQGRFFNFRVHETFR